MFNKMTPPVQGLTHFTTYLATKEEKVKKTTKRQIEASVQYQTTKMIFDVGQIYEKRFDFDRKGLKDAICFMQQTVQNIKRRGICETCNTGERPVSVYVWSTQACVAVVCFIRQCFAGLETRTGSDC